MLIERIVFQACMNAMVEQSIAREKSNKLPTRSSVRVATEIILNPDPKTVSTIYGG